MKITEVKYILTAAESADDSVLMTGLHGIGKTEIVIEWAKENDIFLKVLYLSNQDVSDLIGMPYLKGNVTDWAEPSWLAEMHYSAFPDCELTDLIFNDKKFEEFILSRITDKFVDRNILEDLYKEYYNTKQNNPLTTGQTNVTNKKSQKTALFLDELARSAQDVRQAALQLVLDKKIHQHELPITNGKQTFIVAADNPDNGDYQVDVLDPALRDRFCTIPVDIDVKGWLKWGRENEINPIVLAYITNNTKKLHYTPKEGSENTKGATPRSWAKLSPYIDNFDKTPKSVQYDIIAGKLGTAIALQFLDFYKNYKNIISIEDIENLTTAIRTKTDKLEDIGTGIYDLIQDISVMQKTELVEALVTKYIDKDTKDTYPMMGILYALEVEILVGFLKKYSNDDNDKFLRIAEIDLDLNNKALFIKLAKNL